MNSLSTSSPYKSPTGLRNSQSLENLSWQNRSQMNNRQQFEQGSQESLQPYGDSQSPNKEEFVSASVRPFNNNPALPATQRDIVGNNLHFKSSNQRTDWLEEENDQLAALLLYRDALKRNLTTAVRAGGGLPKMRHGRIGSQWRHIKQTNTYAGANLMFVDGTVRIDDTFKYPIPRFGYPPFKKPQHQFSASYNDLSQFDGKNSEEMNWSANEPSRRRPSASKRPNRENLDWLSDKNVNGHSLNQSFDPSQFHEVKEPVHDRSKYGLH